MVVLLALLALVVGCALGYFLGGSIWDLLTALDGAVAYPPGRQRAQKMGLFFAALWLGTTLAGQM